MHKNALFCFCMTERKVAGSQSSDSKYILLRLYFLIHVCRTDFVSGERVQDIAFWKSELLNEINSIETEYGNLEVLRNE